MSIINEIIHELRSFLMAEDVGPYAIAIIRPMPGGVPEEETHIRVIGFDRAMSRGQVGFGGEDDEDVGSWRILNLPERSATGMYNPTPWVLFMDWLWKLLRDSNLEPMGLEGFGDEAGAPKTVAQKRMRKYGKSVQGEYDVKRDVVMAINSLGKDEEEVARNFKNLMVNASTPDWFKLVELKGYNEWYVIVQMESEMPEGWQERKKYMEEYKEKHRQEWKKAVEELAGGKTNPVQLNPLVKLYLVKKHNFESPFNVDVMNDDEFKRAIDIVRTLKLEDIVEFAKAEGKAPPVIGRPKAGEISVEVLKDRWAQIVDKLADELDADHPTVQVALADYMVKKAGFDDPFEPDLMSPAQFAKAVAIAGGLSGDDIRPFTEDVQKQIRRLFVE
ncbi:MAG: hypothetical protein QXU32_00595 [Nitrososphaerales archaeon]